MNPFWAGVFIGALVMFGVLASIGVYRSSRVNRKRAANSVVHTRDNAVAVVKSAGGQKRAIHSK